MKRGKDLINSVAKAELVWPKVDSIHPCAACGLPGFARFWGVHNKKGYWVHLKPHTLAECRAYRRKETWVNA